MTELPITRTALRYYGGKAALAPWIVAHLPAHEAYLEPYGGGASILLRKPRSLRETYNDLDGAVVAFFRCLRDQPDALVRAIRLTPFAREEMDGADVDDPAITDLERARRLYVRSWQSIHGAPSRGRLGWRCEKAQTGGGTSADAWGRTEHLYAVAARLQGVQIERDDALACIQRFDHAGCLIVADPPYVRSTRGDRWHKAAYTGEMTDADHAALATALRAAAGMVMICGYRCDLYDDLYAGWLRLEHRARTQSRNDATECLWFNPAAAARGRQTLFPLTAADADYADTEGAAS